MNDITHREIYDRRVAVKVKVDALTESAKDANGNDYNIVCKGFLSIDRDTSTAVIRSKIKQMETV